MSRPGARRTCRLLALAALAIGVTVLFGWATGNPRLTSILPAYITMKANTAAALCLLASSILLLSWPRTRADAPASGRLPVRVWIAAALSLAVGVLGALTLGEYVFAVNLGIDELLAFDPDPTGRFPPGRLAPITAVLLMLLASAQLLLIGRRPRLVGLTQGLAIASLLAAFQALVGYASGVTYTFGSAFYTQMALHTAIGLVLVSTAMLALTSEHGLMKVMLGRSESARMMRVVLAAAVIVPPLVNWFAVKGERLGLYDADFGVLLRATANVLFLGIVVWEKGATLHAADIGRQELQANALLVHQIRFKDEFLSHVSHELRSPLTAIKQFTTILLGGLAGRLNPEQQEFQQIVLKNVLQLQAMIDDLLEVTRLETGKLSVAPEKVAADEAVTDAIDTLRGMAQAKGVAVSAGLTSGVPAAYADPARLRQILIILIDNAIKFTSEGGAVTVRAVRRPQDPRFLQIAVSDTGCGIAPENVARIFDRLYQVEGAAESSRKGLGLGLYICKELVSRQGGTMQIESTPGSGSTFSFTVPVFCLDNAIAPLFKNGRWPGAAVALVAVATRFPGGAPSPALRQEFSTRVRSVLRQCLFPDVDVLLPRIGHSDDDRAYVAAFAEPTGAAALAGRVRGQLESDRRPADPAINVAVSYRMLQPAPVAADAPEEAVVASMAALFESSMNEDAASRTA